MSIPERADSVQPCADTGLTAIAQLGVFKLNAKRSTISLFDRKHEHIIAEATRETPLDYKIKDQTGDRRLWLCGTAVSRSLDHPSEHLLTSTPSARLPVLVVPDLVEDDRWSKHSCLVEWPFHRFYAGVPIVSRAGLRIGIYAVFDSTPRSGLTEEEQQFLRDISDTTMRYFQSRTAIAETHRGERMVRGLGSFVEGKGTIASMEHEDFDDDLGKQEGRLNMKQQISHGEIKEDKMRSGGRSPEVVARRSPFMKDRAQLPALKTACLPTIPGRRCTVTTEDASLDVSSFLAKPASITTSDPHFTEVRKTFSRASNVLREAVEVEGAVFLDASISTFPSLCENRGHDTDHSSKGPSRPAFQEVVQYCDVLGFSTTAASSIDGAAPPDYLKFPERLMSILISRYPEGKVFNFDLDGADLSGQSELDDASDVRIPDAKPFHGDKEKIRRASRAFQSHEGQAGAINHILPGARSVAVVPLWDPIKERWFSSGILWTNSPNRIFTTQGELSFLRAFGTTIMAEVQSVNASMSEKAKSDFLGSLSHELRSPLHGVIAAAELLTDSNIDAFQGDAVHTIESKPIPTFRKALCLASGNKHIACANTSLAASR